MDFKEKRICLLISVIYEFFYMDENYQEIVNQRDFTMEDFWSSTGGFVGMIVGYSLIQLTDVISRIWEWVYGRKKHDGNK